MKFYCVRHGQTVFNTRKMYQGWCDSPLTEKGIEDAKAVGKGLENIPFVQGYSSTSERAVDTMDCILENRNVPKTHLKGLREAHFGELEGTVIDPNTQWEEIMKVGFQKYGGESIQEAVDRFQNTLKNIAKESQEGNILIVSHGAILRYTAATIDLQKMENYSKNGHDMDNCCVMILDYTNDKFTLEDFGNSSYRDSGRR